MSRTPLYALAAAHAPAHVTRWNRPFPLWPALLLLPLLWLARPAADPASLTTAAR